jgi:SAM-dependent methyltransferase
MLSVELFGESVTLPRFPEGLGSLKGMGLSDQLSYAVPLAKKTAYVNTFYDREPFFDVMAAHPELYGTYKFILSADVFEHIPIPVERALEEAYKLLQPDGCLYITVPSSLDEETVEHYPNLYQYSIVNLGGCHVLVNRTKDGEIEVHRDLVFHGGPGATLEMRLFSRRDLTQKLLSVGFSEVIFQDDPVEELGIVFGGKWGRPMLARKGKPVGGC